MIIYFFIPYILTFIIIRSLTTFLHKPFAKKANTPTGYIRRKSGLDVHHIHFGFLFLIVSIIYYFLNGYSSIFLIIFSISLSLIADQIMPWLKLSDYFGYKGITWAIIFHILFALIFYFTFY